MRCQLKQLLLLYYNICLCYSGVECAYRVASQDQTGVSNSKSNVATFKVAELSLYEIRLKNSPVNRLIGNLKWKISTTEIADWESGLFCQMVDAVKVNGCRGTGPLKFIISKLNRASCGKDGYCIKTQHWS